MKFSSREKILLVILAGLILAILSVYLLFTLHKNKLLEYNNKTYIVSSADDKITGTIVTRVNGCGEFGEKCVYAEYNLIVSDNIPPKPINRQVTDDSYFDPNYFYAVNIYNNELNPHEYSYDSNLKTIDNFFPSGKFLINFKKVLSGRSCAEDEFSKYCFGYSPDAFLKLTHADIYDASDPAYVNSEDKWVDSFAPFKSANKIRSYDFTVIPQ